MIRFHGRRGVLGRITLGSLVACMALATAIAGCSDQPTEVDPTYVMPEGTPSRNSRLVMWYDQSNVVTVYRDFIPPGPNRDDGDTVIRTVEYRRAAPTTITGMIFDSTAASGFQVLRRESGGGFRQFQDFLAARTKRWLDYQWELFKFTDPIPAVEPPTYVGRGLVLGIANARSPLTNVSQIPTSSMIPIVYTGERAPSDSLFTISWNPVMGAAGYIIHVYEFRTDLRSVDEKILSGAAAPIYDGQSRDILVAFHDGTGPTSYRIGDVRPDVQILTRRTTFFGSVYQVRVSAFDADGRMIGCTIGDNEIQQGYDGDGTYALYPLGSAKVNPTPLGARAPDPLH